MENNFNNILVDGNGNFSIHQEHYDINVLPRTKKLGVMVVGLGGNNGSTLAAGLIAYRNKIKWSNKTGEHDVHFYGSMSQYGSVHIGYDKNNKAHSRLFKDIGDMYAPEDIIIGGWDINSDNLYNAAKKAKVLDHDLLTRLESTLTLIIPLASIYNPDFIATNQRTRANNVIKLHNDIGLKNHIVEDIVNFKKENDVDTVLIMWSASTERFNKGTWADRHQLQQAMYDNDDPEISPSIIFAVAAAEAGCIFINGSPQNTLVPAVIDHAKYHGTFVGGDDFKTGQTKIKSVLVDWLVSGGIKPLSIVSYNHLGNNDGKNLDEAPQFQSKEITKKNVIDDVVAENPAIFPDGTGPDHAVVIKYVPAVGDSKRAMDEYYSELFLGGRHTLAMHNTCEDSLLAVPIILDIIVFAEFFSRINITTQGNMHRFNTVLSFLSIFFKAPVTNDNEPLINAFFRQRTGLENFFRALLGLPPADHMYVDKRI